MGLVFVLSICVIYLDWRLTSHNWGVIWNGIGCVDSVCSGEAQQPMAYRVLVPWLTGFIGDKVVCYTLLRWFSIWFGLFGSWLFYGGDQLLVALVAVYFMVSALYDYTDGYLEVGFYGLSLWMYMVGMYWLIPVVLLVATLNRESSVFMLAFPFVFDVWWVFPFVLVAFGVGYMVPRLLYGKRARYCPFNMISRNIAGMREMFKDWRVLYSEYAIFLIIVLLLAVAVIKGSGLLPWLALVMFLALLVPSLWREVRVYGVVVLLSLPYCL